MINIIAKKQSQIFKWYDIGTVNDYKCIHIKIILPDVTSYVMALKNKKEWYVGLFFFLERVKKNVMEHAVHWTTLSKSKLHKWYLKNWLFKSS